tara:strand:- start:3184 stop:4128 length:945 start_codon:yes stop_codon:yes gene_type:complete
MTSIIIIISIVFSGILAPLIQKLFLNFKKIDPINHRSSHSVLATRTGGITSFIALFTISFYYYIIGIEIYDYSILIPLSTMFIVGVYDDFYNADFKLKFFMQIIVAKMLIDQGLIIDNFYGVLGLNEIPRLFSQLFTIFVFLVIVNSINFIDGIDGLAITEIIKILSIFIFIVPDNGNITLFYIGVISVATLIPLYYFNYRRKNKIFLGDGGSLYLGTLISIFVFNFLNSDFNFPYSYNKPILSILILLYPLIDLLRVFVIRIYNKKSPFYPDNNHIHHFFLRKNLSHWIISLILPLVFLIGSYSIFYFLTFIK